MPSKIHAYLTKNIHTAINKIKTYCLSYLPETIITYLFLKAVAANKPNDVKILLKLGADVNATNQHGDAAIHMACAFENADVLKTLLDSKHINLGATNKTGINAIVLAFDKSKAAFRTLNRIQLPPPEIAIENTQHISFHYNPKPENARKRVTFHI